MDLYFLSIVVLIISVIGLVFNLRHKIKASTTKIFKVSTTEFCLLIVAFCMLINTGYLLYTHIKLKKDIENTRIKLKKDIEKILPENK